MPKGIDARAVVEAADGGLSPDSGGRAIHTGEKIEAGSVVRANGSGAMLKLADGSHVEMRGNSKLSLERADDGVRIKLSDGDVIVSAAKQHGHLYVQTKDVNVPVAGTVFLVNAEEEAHVRLLPKGSSGL
jgi:ferric-dicitrate binding protein FerR (iron transport regulator)